ncbi:MAG TPA: glycosyltransferase family 39 protein [Terriglobales bacterium]|nr:glycosyltransferase family 39 protein [Terriglobales bacterium]
MQQAEPNSRIALFLAAMLLALMAVLSGGAARRESITIDEFAHTAAGVSYWQKLDLRLNEEHPPLSKLLAGLPLFIRGAHADYSNVSWTFSSKLFHQYLGEWAFGEGFLLRWNDPRSTIWWARLPMLLMTLLLGFVLYLLGSRLGGRWGGLLCLACYATTPAFLAFGPLVVTDVFITLFWVLTVWLMPRLWRSPSTQDLLLVGLAFAGALLSKFSSGLLLLVFPAVSLSLRWRPLPEIPTEKVERRRWRRRAWWNCLKAVAWAGIFVYAVYFIFSWHQSSDSFSVMPNFPSSPILRRVLMPPWIYLRGLGGFVASAGSRPTFLLGHSYPHGVWFYFPVIFALKSQLSFLLLLGMGLALAIFTRAKRLAGPEDGPIQPGWELHWRCLWVSLVVYVGACMLNRLDISVRHFLIAIALLTLLLAPLPRRLQRLRASRPALATAGALSTFVLVFFSLVSAVRSYPHYLPYLNSLAMGKPAYLLVNDSNLDWDQAFPEVEQFALEHSRSVVLLDRYGFSEPEFYAPHARLWDCQNPAPGDAGLWAIVSGNNLADARNCAWLIEYSPQALAGGSMYAFHLPNPIPPAGKPGGPPERKDWHFFGGNLLPFDIRDTFTLCLRDPAQLEPTFERIMEIGRQMRKHEQKP